MYLQKEKEGFTYLEEGEGRTIVLLHGLMGGLSNFDAITSFFSKKGYKVFVPSLPLYSLEVKDTNVENIAIFVERFLTEIVKEPTILIGNSLGGHVGLIVTREHTDKVRALVLTGSSGLYEKSFGETIPRRGDYEYVKRKSEEVFYDPKVATKEIVDDIFKTVNDRERAIRTLYIARSAMKHNMNEELKHINQPVCLIWGKQDIVTPPEVATAFNEGLANASLYWIDKCGHAAMMEHPEVFNQLLGDWLDANELMPV